MRALHASTERAATATTRPVDRPLVQVARCAGPLCCPPPGEPRPAVGAARHGSGAAANRGASPPAKPARGLIRAVT